jgi:biotin/methionine sulfoxide reductase
MTAKRELVPHHAHWGAFLAEVEDGRFVGVRPFGRDPDPSPMIEAMPAAVYSAMRVAQPIVRVGWLPGRGGEGRGREPFVTLSWERSLALVAAELDRVRRDHGADAIMGGSQGWGSAGLFHDARTQVRRFLAASGGFVDQAANYSFGTALAFLPHVLGSAQAVTGPLTSWSSIARHSRLLVLFGGANPKKHAGGQRRLRRARGRRLDAGAGASRRRRRQHQPNSRRRPRAGQRHVDSDPAEH